jgi:hypothetical protein
VVLGAPRLTVENSDGARSGKPLIVDFCFPKGLIQPRLIERYLAPSRAYRTGSRASDQRPCDQRPERASSGEFRKASVKRASTVLARRGKAWRRMAD